MGTYSRENFEQLRDTQNVAEIYQYKNDFEAAALDAGSVTPGSFGTIQQVDLCSVDDGRLLAASAARKPAPPEQAIVPDSLMRIRCHPVCVYLARRGT
jgi:hypothetical protein